MRPLIPTSYQELIEQAAQFSTCSKPRAEDLLRHLDFRGVSLQAQAPIYYVVDYSEHRYLYIDPSCKQVLGYEINQLSAAGPSYFVSLWHPEDFRIYNEWIFPETIAFLKNHDLADYSKFSISLNYRIKNCRGKYLTMLQRSTMFADPNTGMPVGAVGFIIDITHFHDNLDIIFTIDRVDRHFSSLCTESILKKVYYPKSSTSLLTRRELEILHLIYEGQCSKTIANLLSVSLHTVNNHRKHMLEKTGCRNASELIHFAIQERLL